MSGRCIVLERQTGLEEICETGVMIHADLSTDLIRTIFTPRSALHDGAVIVRDGSIVAAGALLPLAETSIQAERFGTRHRAALGITEQTDAVVVVVSEENGQVSLVERARIRRNLSEPQLERALIALLGRSGGLTGGMTGRRERYQGRLLRIGDLRQRALRRAGRPVPGSGAGEGGPPVVSKGAGQAAVRGRDGRADTESKAAAAQLHR